MKRSSSQVLLLHHAPRRRKSVRLPIWIPLLLVLLAGCAPRLSVAPRLPTMRQHTITTKDGWKLGAVHLPPLAEPRPGQAPVILCHGTSSNIANVDLIERSSLARYLARAGFDVWMVELRGGPLGARPKKGGGFTTGRYKGLRERHLDWDLDTHVEQDVPAIRQAVLGWTGAPQAHWLGHSLGGIVAWAAEVRGTVPGWRSLVGVGSPGSFGHPSRTAGIVPRFGWAMKALHGLPSRGLMRAFGPLMRVVPNPIGPSLMNPQNMDPAEMSLLIRTVLEDSPPGLMRQYVRWIQAGEIVSRDGAYSYTRNLSRLRSPVAVISGRADGIAPPWTVKPVYDGASSEERRFRVFGLAEGDHADYGHFDLVLGQYAPADVFPWIRAWLEGH